MIRHFHDVLVEGLLYCSNAKIQNIVKMGYKNSLVLPSGKLIDNIDNVKDITDVSSKTDKYSSPEKTWHEFDIYYDDHSVITLSYEIFTTAAADRMFLVRFLNKV